MSVLIVQAVAENQMVPYEYQMQPELYVVRPSEWR